MNRVNVPQLRFPRFDGKWEKKKLGDVLNITSASRVHKDEWTEEGVPFFRSSDVVAAFNGKQNIKAYIPFDLYNSLSKKIGKVKIDDLLITGGGSIGIPFLIEKNDPLYFKDADLLWIKNSGNISGYFLYSFFLTPLFKNHLKSVSHIGTIAHYTVIQAKNTPFNTPSLPEQQKIASFLSAVDEKIKQISRKKELLEQYKKGLMQQLFSGKLRFKDENGNDYADWEEKKLGAVATKKSSNISANKIEENFGDFIIYGASGVLKKVDFYKEENDYVSIVKDGAGVGRLLYCKGKSSVLGTMEIISPKQNIDTYFLYCLLSNIDFVKYVTGSTIPHIYFKDYSGELCRIPSISEQRKIAVFLSSIDIKIESTKQQIIQTQNFKKGLLQQMFV
jgi:type I restriction enzyme S subunit